MVKRGITPQQAKEIREKKGIEETKMQKIRVSKGLSQGELARLANISARTIQCYEQEARPIEGAKLNTLCNICTVLGCKIEDILEDEELIKQYKAVK